jgi:hypothetical protein
VDSELNYVNYFTEIERCFQVQRQAFTLVSSLDWVLIENWKERGIPLEIVLKGIERAFSNPRRRRKINTLAYCLKAVEQVLEEQKDLRVEKPQLPDFQDGEVASYLDRLAAEVSRIDVDAASSIRAVDAGDLRNAEQTLSALEEKLIARLKSTAEDRTIIEIQREVNDELNPFRSTMSAPQLAMVEQQMWRRKLLDRHDLPRLSLFYLI